MFSPKLILFLFLLLGSLPMSGFAQEDIADVRSKKFTLDNRKLQYYLIGSKEKRKAPEDGYKLLVVMPGGDGSADFLPFVKRIYKHALDDDYLIVQLIAPKWNRQQQIVWPVARDNVRGMKVPLEDFVAQAVADVAGRTRINDKQVHSLSWSSGGPAAYAISLAEDTPVKGSLVAMSVYKPANMPDLAVAEGKPYYLLHSPEDRVCPFRFAKQAQSELSENGAVVELATYDGGHGWLGDVYGNIRRGIKWLEEHSPNEPKQ